MTIIWHKNHLTARSCGENTLNCDDRRRQLRRWAIAIAVGAGSALSGVDEALAGGNPYDENAANCNGPLLPGSIENGAFVWRDCSGRWHVRTGWNHSDSRASVTGRIGSSTGFRYHAGYDLESHDFFKISAFEEATFDLRVTGSSFDGFDFETKDGASVCVDVRLSVGNAAQYTRVGPYRTPVNMPVDPVSLQSCEPNPTLGLLVPVPSSTLGGSVGQFVFNRAGQQILDWRIEVGSSAGASDYFMNTSSANADSVTVTGLPVDGSLIFVTLWYQLADASWQSLSYSYTAASTTTGGTQTSCPSPGYLPIDVSQADWFVAPDGDNQNNDGSISAPFKTLYRAALSANPGDLILMRGGVYNQQQSIFSGGAPGNPITIAAYPGEQPVVDGAGLNISINQGLVRVLASDVVVDGIEIRNSPSRGFQVYDSDRVTLRRSYVHDIMTKGYSGSGDDLVVEDNVFTDLVLANLNGAGLPPWDAGIATWYRPGGAASQRLTLRNNHISRAWGECVGLVFSDAADVVDNVIHDCYSVGLYLDNSRNTTVNRNVLYTTSDEFDRVDNGRSMFGIEMAVENYAGVNNIRVENTKITNNLVIDTDRGIGFYDDKNNTNSAQNSYRDITVAHNVVCGTTHEPIQFQLPSGDTPSASVLTNNVLCKGSQHSTTQVAVSVAAAWSIDFNSYPDGAASNAGSGHFFGAPGFTVGTGYARQSYRLEATSQLIAAGAVVASNTDDAFCRLRNNNQPSVGLHEY